MQLLLTKNEARVLENISPDSGCYFYELSSVTQLTPTDIAAAVQSLESKGFIRVDPDRRYATLTGDGIGMQREISPSSLSDSRLNFNQTYTTSSAEVAPSEPEESEMSEQDLSAAIDAAMDKLD